jgi:hypothetical protein
MPDYIDPTPGEDLTVTFKWGNCNRVMRRDPTKPPYYKFDLDNGRSLRASQALAEALGANWPGQSGTASIQTLSGDQYNVVVDHQEYAEVYPLKVTEYNPTTSSYVDVDVWDCEAGQFVKVATLSLVGAAPAAQNAPQAPQAPQAAPTAPAAPQPPRPAPTASYDELVEFLGVCLESATNLHQNLDTGAGAEAIQATAATLFIECNKKGIRPVTMSADPEPPHDDPPPPTEPPPDDDLPF